MNIKDGLPTKEGYYWIQHPDGIPFIVQVWLPTLAETRVFWYPGSKEARSVTDPEVKWIRRIKDEMVGDVWIPKSNPTSKVYA
jgi:hypothetical protein